MRRLVISAVVSVVALCAAFAGVAAEEPGKSTELSFRCVKHELLPDRVRGVSNSASGVALGDVNGDGHLDALIKFGRSFSVWSGNGDGHFTETGWFACRPADDIRLADLDADGDLDAILTVSLWKNNGKGEFTENGQVLGSNTRPSVFCDLDNDGDLDAISTRPLSIHWNTGKGQFTQKIVDTDRGLAGVLAVADMDRDGLLDIGFLGKARGAQSEGRIVFNEGGKFAKVTKIELLGDKQLVTGWNDKKYINKVGSFFGLFDLSLCEPHDLALADFDGDGDMDLVVTRGYTIEFSISDYVWLNEGNGKFQLKQSLRESDSTALALADFDQDGNLDLFVGGFNSWSVLWLNDGKGGFRDSGVDFGAATYDADVGDVDGDGDTDIVIVGSRPPRVWINETKAKADETEK